MPKLKQTNNAADTLLENTPGDAILQQKGGEPDVEAKKTVAKSKDKDNYAKLQFYCEKDLIMELKTRALAGDLGDLSDILNRFCKEGLERH